MNHRVAAAESGSIQTETGLVYKETVTGTGIVPTQLDTVGVHYVGRLIDGTVFDSSIARGYASSINVPHSMMMRGHFSMRATRPATSTHQTAPSFFLSLYLVLVW